MASNESNMIVAVVGGGPIGALAALYLAKRGWTIHLFESRPDPRLSSSGSGKSINLALSVRGIEAMRRVGGGVVEEVMRWVVPMRGRMIHTPTGEQISQAYSVTGEVGINWIVELGLELEQMDTRFGHGSHIGRGFLLKRPPEFRCSESLE
jgi:2-polyprenyl-6-methoxyphenol hydroxylase-like FAD-dependent oxidoreductase